MPISYAYTPQEISNFEITRIREESLEVRLNVVMNKFAEEGINFTVKSIHGEFEFVIGCDIVHHLTSTLNQ